MLLTDRVPRWVRHRLRGLGGAGALANVELVLADTAAARERVDMFVRRRAEPVTTRVA